MNFFVTFGLENSLLTKSPPFLNTLYAGDVLKFQKHGIKSMLFLYLKKENKMTSDYRGTSLLNTG
jgi:hypothetical protein